MFRRRVQLIATGITFVIFFFLTFNSPRTSGQQNFPQPNRKPACTCFCGDNTFASFNLFSAEDVKAGKCYGGPLPTEACAETVGELPGPQRAALCQRLKAGGSSSCPAVKAACEGVPDSQPPKSDCEKPAPWFDPQAGCKDVQAPVVAINNKAVTVSVCGYPIFRGVPDDPNDPLLLEAYMSILTGYVKSRVGSKVCCDALRDAAKTGSPCYPAVDIDCDGKPNSTDIVRDGSVMVPDINTFTKAKNALIDDFPPGLDPDDPNFMPNSTGRDSKNVGDCPCKWELTKGTLSCSPDGRQDHVYTATWKCPATGKEVFTTKYANASAPCKQYKRAAAIFDELSPRPVTFLEFIDPTVRFGMYDLGE